ncbi:MAG: class I SAM-dependent methyltransferase [Anaerolineae bacterium]|nr:class I SAM-dependent methyltransferase [Anaerolineae bacterium]
MNTQSPSLILKPDRQKSLLRRHPWVFSGAVARLVGQPQPGAVVDILASDGQFLAQAAYSPDSQIRARVWTWDRQDHVDTAFLRQRLQAAISSRQSLLDANESNAVRLVHAESDGLPGLVVDQYGDLLVVQLLSWGVDHFRETIADLSLELTGAAAIYERSDAEVRHLEGLALRSQILRGSLSQSLYPIHEHEVKYLVDVAAGHKTGFYIDQRANRLLVRQLSRGREVLDCFSYSGGFTLNALKGEAASVTMVDDSAEALALAQQNITLNNLPIDKVESIDGDVFKILRKFRDQARQFDMLILDPPKFAPTRAQANQAARGYKDINLLAFKLLRPGGVLVTFSCSGGVDAALFQKIVAGASLDAGVHARITARLGPGPDHPVALNFPEGDYLKGLVCQIS